MALAGCERTGRRAGPGRKFEGVGEEGDDAISDGHPREDGRRPRQPADGQHHDGDDQAHRWQVREPDTSRGTYPVSETLAPYAAPFAHAEGEQGQGAAGQATLR